jgi:hypothetical protein
VKRERQVKGREQATSVDDRKDREAFVESRLPSKPIGGLQTVVQFVAEAHSTRNGQEKALKPVIEGIRIEACNGETLHVHPPSPLL